jgi:hypothetical protein
MALNMIIEYMKDKQHELLILYGKKEKEEIICIK